MKRIIFLIILASTLVGCHQGRAFYSDYISFVGADSRGRVGFAIDDDRQINGSGKEVEIHVMMHDESTGYISLAGNGTFKTPGSNLIPLASTKEFQFLPLQTSAFNRSQSARKQGFRLISKVNGLSLRVEPIVDRIGQQTRDGKIEIGSASATMKWSGRLLKGRVIYEYVVIPRLPSLYALVSGLFYNDFAGLYLKVGQNGDYYSFSSRKSSFGNLDLWNRLQDGMFVSPNPMPRQSVDAHISNFKIKTTKRRWAGGFFSWPTSWSATWQSHSNECSLHARVVDHRDIKWWLIGGYSMDVVSGQITCGSKTYPAYGLAELII